MDAFTELILKIDDGIYSTILIACLLICGLVCTGLTRFVQLRRIPDMFKYMLDKKDAGGNKSLSSFQALMISTGSRVGTGNIAGIATAIIMGGPGSVFWMWILAIIGASSAFVESTLAQIWKRKGSQGSFRGGPAYYIEQGLGKRWLGILFAVFLIITFAFGFNGLQSFNAVSSLDFYCEQNGLDVNTVHIIAGGLLTILAGLTIFGGMGLIGKVSSIIVPIMAFVYVGLALFTVFSNIEWLGKIFEVIFENAFSLQSILAGTAGTALIYGTKRGLLSNEAGMGSAPNAAATASVSHPVKQGLTQSLSAYIDTFFICTSSAFMVMVFYVMQPDTAQTLNGMPLVQQALSSSIGEWGIHFMTISIFFFAFSSYIGNYSYAEGNFKFITTNRKALMAFRFVCLVPIFFGALSNIELAWGIADIFMAFMAMINFIAIFFLAKWAVKCLKDYEKQKNAGKNPVFYAENIPGLPPTECWHKDE